MYWWEKTTSTKKKRIHWPLGHIKKLVHGKNGKVCLTKLQISHSEMLRPIQRIHPLVVSSTDDAESMFPIPAAKKKQNEQPLMDESCTEIKTKSGKLIKMSDRLIL